MIKRLKRDLIELGKFGRNPPKKIESYDDLDPNNGVTRPLGSESNKMARDYVVEQMEEVGMDVKIDKVGNVFGTKKGLNSNKKSVMVCSHIDSVVNGGMFDGALGVMSGIEAVRRIGEEGFKHGRDIEVAVFTGEEGSSFDYGLLGSSVLTGKISYKEALNLKNKHGEKLKGVLKKIGYLRDYEKEIEDIGYSLEMHIEQGPILESEDVSVGVVENITGIETIIVSIEGKEDHAGTTPMNMRRDALVSASKLVSFVSKEAEYMDSSNESSTVGTVGRLNVHPNETNVIPGMIEMAIDIRDTDESQLLELEKKIMDYIDDIERKDQIKIESKVVSRESPVDLSNDLIETISKTAQGLGIPYKTMSSRAGHDSQNIAKKVKTGMIFVPSVDGVSHSPIEWTRWKDIEKGNKVLTETIKRLSS